MGGGLEGYNLSNGTLSHALSYTKFVMKFDQRDVFPLPIFPESGTDRDLT